MHLPRFAIRKAGSLVWFQTFIQNYKISSNQKEGINSHLKDVHNDLFAPFLGGLFAGQSHCFLYYELLLFICGLLFLWLESHIGFKEKFF